MPTYKIQIEKAAQKFLDRQDRKQRIRLYKAIYALPFGTDIKRLQGYEDLYRLRVGKVRILYSVEESVKIINIENIDNREDVYKDI